jgi:hypothetical protein
MSSAPGRIWGFDTDTAGIPDSSSFETSPSTYWARACSTSFANVRLRKAHADDSSPWMIERLADGRRVRES